MHHHGCLQRPCEHVIWGLESLSTACIITGSLTITVDQAQLDLSAYAWERLAALSVTGCTATTLSLPAGLEAVRGSLAITNNAMLTSVVFPSALEVVGALFVRNNPELAALAVDSPLLHLISDSLVIDNNIKLISVSLPDST